MREDLPFNFLFPNNPSLEPIDTKRFFSFETNPFKINIDAQNKRIQFTGNVHAKSKSPSSSKKSKSKTPQWSSISFNSAPYVNAITPRGPKMFISTLSPITFQFESQESDFDESKDEQLDTISTSSSAIMTHQKRTTYHSNYANYYPDIKKAINVCLHF